MFWKLELCFWNVSLKQNNYSAMLPAACYSNTHTPLSLKLCMTRYALHTNLSPSCCVFPLQIPPPPTVVWASKKPQHLEYKCTCGIICTTMLCLHTPSSYTYTPPPPPPYWSYFISRHCKVWRPTKYMLKQINQGVIERHTFKLLRIPHFNIFACKLEW